MKSTANRSDYAAKADAVPPSADAQADGFESLRQMHQSEMAEDDVICWRISAGCAGSIIRPEFTQ